MCSVLRKDLRMNHSLGTSTVPSITEHLQKVSTASGNTYLQCGQNWYIICSTWLARFSARECFNGPSGSARILAESIVLRLGVNWCPRVSGEIADDSPPSNFYCL